MPVHKLNDYQQIKAKEIIADVFLFNGNAHKAIAEIEKQLQVSVSYQLIYYYLRQIKKDWSAKTQKSVEEIKAKELAKIDKLESEAISEWQRSKSKSTTVTTFSSSQGDSGTSTTTTKIEERIGETALLNTLIKLAERRSKLLGLDAPIKQDLKQDQTLQINVKPIDYRSIIAPLAQGSSEDSDPSGKD